MTFLAKLIFVSASWCPVYLLISALLWTSNPFPSRILLGVTIASLLSIWLVKRIAEVRFAKEMVWIEECRTKQDDLFMYVLSYIPPFFALDLSSKTKVAALVLLYVFIFITYVRLDQYHLNPVFVFFGYRVHTVRTSTGRHLHVISKSSQSIRAGEQIRVAIYDDLALLA